MRTVTLEEHVTFPELLRHFATLAGPQGAQAVERSPFVQSLEGRLADVGEERLKSMDANGIDVQVLSIVGTGAEALEPAQGVDFAYLYNLGQARRLGSPSP